MKSASLLVIALIVIGIYWFIKTDSKDNKARKDAILVEATVEKLRCKQRLKGDKSLLVVNYKNKSYNLFLPEKKCNTYTLQQTIKVYYSKSFDKLFLEE